MRRATRRLLGTFKWALAATVAALLAAAVYAQPSAAGLVAILIALEGSISFDNAVVNAGVLRRMSEGWQRAFLTIGLAIAVFGMRLVFPIAIVAVATGAGMLDVASQALNDQEAYASRIEMAKPIIGAFGGAFLLMVALGFFLDQGREVHWIGPVERRLAWSGRITGAPAAVTALAIVVTSQIVPSDAERDVLLAGIAGLVSNVFVRGIAAIFEARSPDDRGEGSAAGAAGLGAFLYLELLDASFSLDGVLGAFAITQDIVLVALGLGVGALYVRSLTIVLVRGGALRRYPYLAHGAHWAIAALAVVLFVSTEHHVPEWLTGLVGLGLVAAAFASSRRERDADGGDEQAERRAPAGAAG